MSAPERESDRFGAAVGRKVVSSATAEELGNVTNLLVDTGRRTIVSVMVGKKRKARVFAWESLTAFGVDAVMVTDEATLREPQDEREQAASRGKPDLLGSRVLTDAGNELGTVEDVIFDPETGVLEAFVVGGIEEPADSLLGAGSYAVVLRAAIEEADEDGADPGASAQATSEDSAGQGAAGAGTEGTSEDSAGQGAAGASPAPGGADAQA